MYHSKYRVRERIEYRFRVSSAAVFTIYSYSKTLEYLFRVSTAGSLTPNARVSVQVTPDTSGEHRSGAHMTHMCSSETSVMKYIS
jgi:hypothetical protein